MTNDSYFPLGDEYFPFGDKEEEEEGEEEEEMVSWKCASPCMYTAWQIIEKPDLILDTHSTDYTW